MACNPSEATPAVWFCVIDCCVNAVFDWALLDWALFDWALLDWFTTSLDSEAALRSTALLVIDRLPELGR